jgi:hypothetical protein
VDLEAAQEGVAHTDVTNGPDRQVDDFQMCREPERPQLNDVPSLFEDDPFVARGTAMIESSSRPWYGLLTCCTR